MVYLIDARIDYNLLQGRLDELLPLEWQQTSKMFDSGQLLGIWRKASAKGVVAIWNLPDHEAVHAQIRAMPLPVPVHERHRGDAAGASSQVPALLRRAG